MHSGLPSNTKQWNPLNEAQSRGDFPWPKRGQENLIIIAVTTACYLPRQIPNTNMKYLRWS